MTNDGLTIADAAERTGLTAHTLRYYKRDGLMLGVGRIGSGHRRGDSDETRPGMVTRWAAALLAVSTVGTARAHT